MSFRSRIVCISCSVPAERRVEALVVPNEMVLYTVLRTFHVLPIRIDERRHQRSTGGTQRLSPQIGMARLGELH